ncbi:bifunctional metallophosphatase/5'-nucleotidase [Halopelagius longus]|uniref:2',3'-cyclic-nucleotide 2'-phosphodiesterase/5'-or 3'-nucleotidase, 5'-nucleotidase family n=1 Tax=Halopelagius longus TaxID=1236180 RepID=A0A1H0YYK4_9EURY|nr:bifunctional metallophosphatase/5'-nucleotidase [Halopelagius longus]RDI72743.1 bifunctional metallophosphatase/5'-nucleotidase [Halopelagius longus]SDQ20357.1 2',3'-cyclic-nucleotide 2'-phosphodiesterase/5'-or 3'-nucleotidase, 5'-nucleotidase family [Halopelagius longus]
MPRLLHYSDIENVYDDPARVARLAGRIRELDGEDALVCGSGDNTSPGVLPLVDRGRQALDFFDAVGTDVSTFGNHDFDYGPAAARSLVADAPQTWVSANVRDEDGGRFAADHVTPYAVLEADGDSVGFFGVTDPATPSLNPMAADLAFADPYEAAERAVAAIRDEGADYVVALSHLGGGDDELARRVDVDVVLGGHVHSERRERVAGTLLLRPGVNGHAVYEVELGDDGAEATRRETAGAAPVAAVESRLRGRIEAAGLNEVVATVETPIERSDQAVHRGECRVGNFVADAYRWASGADVGLQNSGGIRDGPAISGEVTLKDCISLIPFEEPLVTVELTGRELTRVFSECSSATVDFGEPDWWHGHVSGASFVLDEETAAVLEARVGGEPVDPDATYTVATSDYVLHSDHEFPTIEESHRVGEGDILHDVLAEYARECGVSPEVEGRMRRVRGAPADDD